MKIEYNKMVRECECGNKPFVKEYSFGMGEFSFIIKCKKCNKSVIYTPYDEEYIKGAIKEWNKFTYLLSNPIQSYSKSLFETGYNYTEDEIISNLMGKFNINFIDASLYYNKYIYSKIYELYCDFFQYRYTGMLSNDYIKIIQEKYNLSDEAINNYHKTWIENMDKINGKFIEEGIDYSKIKTKNKIYNKDSNKK